MPLADALDIPLQRLKARYEASPLPAFLRWWLGELRSFLPARWQSALRTESTWVELDPVPGGLDVRLPGGAVAQLREDDPEALALALDRLLADAGDLRRVLVLPPARVLRRRLSLPAAARERLRAVLGFELDRQTPFKPDQVHFDARVRGDEAGGKQISVELALVPRAQLDAQLAPLGPLAKALDAVDVRGTDGRRAGFNLLPAERRVRRAHVWMWINAGLVAAILVLLLLAMSQTLSNREEALARLDAEIEAQRAEARAVTQFRRGLDEAVEGANFLAVRRAQQPLMVDLLNELTRLLPDDTYLERLNFDGQRVTIHGLSSQAAGLLPLLQSSTVLRDPSLSGPIQPDQRVGKDRFQITAGYGPQTEEKAGAADARR